MSDHAPDDATHWAGSCPRCRGPLDAPAAEGVCPRCVLEQLLHMPSASEETDGALGRFGDYELLELIARGGMGTVYRARHAVLNRIVALKLIPVSAAAEPGSLERFQTEARAAASLDHPHIAPVYEFGEWDGAQFLTMKFVEGGTLATALAREGERGRFARNHPAALQEGVRVVVKVARAVHFAHQRGVLHRDIKPGNILLDAHGEPQLVDFGLAKLVQQDSTITRSLAVLGTPAFMAPEQAAGRTREITTAADVYGLGALLYSVATGVPPFAGGTTFETIGMVLGQEPKPPSQLNHAVDRDLQTICLKCLEKESSRRYGSAEALADDLDRWLKGEPVLARPAPPVERLLKWGRRHRARAAILGISLVSLAVLVTLSVAMNVRLSAARQLISGQAESRRAELVQLNVVSGNRLAETGDGFAALKSFAEAARLDADSPDAFAVQRDRFAMTRSQLPTLVHEWRQTGVVYCARFSPDGGRIVAAGADQRARIWSVADGSRIGADMVQASPILWAGFSPDGSVVATRTVAGVVQVWDGTNGAPVAGPFPAARIIAIRDAAHLGVGFHPARPLVAVPTTNGAAVHSWGPDAAGPVLIRTESRGVDAFFSPDGTRLVVMTDRDGVLVCDAADGRPLTVIRPGHLPRNGSWSPDGTLLSLSDGFRSFTFDAATGAQVSAMMEYDDYVLGSRFSADSALLLTHCYDNTARIHDSRTGRMLVSPLRHMGVVRSAVFSPDEERVLTASMDGTVRLWNRRTGEPAGDLLRTPRGATHAEFSPQGELAAVSSADGSIRVWRLPSNGFAHREWLADSPTERVVFSPDSRNVACVGLTGWVHLWDAVSGERLREPLPNASRALDCAWMDDRTLRVMTSDGFMRIWDIPSGTVVSSNRIPDQVARASMTFMLRGGRRLLTTGDDAVSQLWSLDPWKRMATHDHESRGRIPAISEDGHHVATVNARNVRIWEAEAGRRIGKDLVADTYPDLVAVSSDGRRVAITHDYSASLWDVASGLKIGQAMQHAGRIRGITFMPDSRYLVTASDDRTARVWDTATGHAVGPPLLHLKRALAVDVRADSRAFATSSSDGRARIWTIPDGPRSPGEMMDEALRLNGDR